MKKNQNGHDLTDTHAPMTAALSVSVLDTLLFPLWNENTTKMVSRPTQSPGQIPPQNRTCRTTASGS
ncbi:hypothetical protein, partial [Xenorhabdus bovienii]|uniref:hypothetical protein n=1 Tax=Xenorhabdus bovienii TaxID=40576 RepID=UPI00056FDCCF